MTTKPKISIVIPFYNAEKTLPKTLESIRKSIVAFGKSEMISLILVNNNSTDDSKSIAQNWAKTITVKVYLIDEFRQGVSYARNCGIDHANGEFLAFIDADDEIELDYFNEIIRALDSSLDLLVLNPINGGLGIKSFPVCKKPEYIDCSNFEALYFFDTWCNWRFVTRLSLISMQRFLGSCYEDFGIYPLVLANSKKIRIVKKSIYLYQNNPESLTRTIGANSIEQLKLQFTRLKKCLKRGSPICKRVSSDYFELLTLHRAINEQFPIQSPNELLLIFDYFSTRTFSDGLRRLIYRIASVLKRKLKRKM